MYALREKIGDDAQFFDLGLALVDAGPGIGPGLMSAWLKPDSMEPPTMPLTLATEPFVATALTLILSVETALAIMPPTG